MKAPSLTGSWFTAPAERSNKLHVSLRNLWVGNCAWEIWTDVWLLGIYSRSSHLVLLSPILIPLRILGLNHVKDSDRAEHILLHVSSLQVELASAIRGYTYASLVTAFMQIKVGGSSHRKGKGHSPSVLYFHSKICLPAAGGLVTNCISLLHPFLRDIII